MKSINRVIRFTQFEFQMIQIVSKAHVCNQSMIIASKDSIDTQLF